MTEPRRARRAGAAVLCAVLATWTAPATQAVTPPDVDRSLLPAARPPAPPGATEPAGPCQRPPRATQTNRNTQAASLGLPAAWPLSRGSGQTVAVIDTGVTRHRLLPRLTAGGDYVSTGDGTQDCDGHGTIVAGIIAAAPADGFSGVAPDANILSIRQSSNVFRLSRGDTGPGVGDVDTLAMAVRTAADLGATVINVSSVACVRSADGIDDGALGAALAYAVDVKNVVVVAAAGNVGGSGQCPGQNLPPDPARPGVPDWDHVDVVVSPSWYDDYVLTVGSVGPDGRPSSFTLAGPWVDVAAPGESVVSLSSDGESLVDVSAEGDGEEPISGTSYATPVVSGIVALIRSRSPHLTARQVMHRIEATAHHPSAGWNPFVGAGVVDPLAALGADDGQPSQPRAVRAAVEQPAAVAPADPRVRTVAFGGAAACLAVAVAAATLSMGLLRRLRRRRAVVND